MENNDEKFLRIGTQIYLKEINPSGQEQLLPWSTSAIYQDYGKDRGNEIISHMPKYVGWANEPSHTDYQPIIGKWLNLYQALPYEPRSGADFPNIQLFLQHIFGNLYHLGLDYLQLLYLQPKQKLPILMLVSKERNTGKSTFLKFLKAIYGANATFNTNEDFKSQFNSDWANKLLIMVDEAFLDKVEYTERLKNLSTATIYKAEAKGKDRIECDFHGKFILCSNNVERPVIIEPGETRFWVIQVAKLKSDDTQLLDKMIYEIPAFLDFLAHREMSTKCFSRMWFSFDDYHTRALDRIIASNRSRLEQQIAYVLVDIMESYRLDTIDICLRDIYAILMFRGCAGRYELEERNIKRVLQNSWDLTPVGNGLTYTRYMPSGTQSGEYTPVKAIGRYYTIRYDFIKNI
ncbi:MAG: helicase [Prevotella sp.]|nr:helicase [Prevotella sp.]